MDSVSETKREFSSCCPCIFPLVPRRSPVNVPIRAAVHEKLGSHFRACDSAARRRLLERQEHLRPASGRPAVVEREHTRWQQHVGV